MTPIINDKGTHVGLEFDYKNGDIFYSDKSLHYIAKAKMDGSGTVAVGAVHCGLEQPRIET